MEHGFGGEQVNIAQEYAYSESWSIQNAEFPRWIEQTIHWIEHNYARFIIITIMEATLKSQEL